MIISQEVQNMCPVAQGVHHGAAPIPEEAKWVKAKEVKDISGFTHGVGWCAPQQGACKLTLNVKEGIIHQPNCDFGKHIIPYCHDKGDRLFAYEYNGYWKDVGTLSSYWEANMELIDIIPEFNLYEEFWKIYTNSANIPPQYIAQDGVVDRCIISNGTEVYGELHNSVLGGRVRVGKGSVVRDSIIMQGVTIGENCVIDRAIIAEDTVIGDNVVIGIGSDVPNKMKPNIYSGGLATIGENSVIPSNVQIGKNTAISGVTAAEDYEDGVLASGETLIKAGERV